MTERYSFKGAYPYDLPVDMTGYDLADFAPAGPAPALAPGEVLDWDGAVWEVRGPNSSELALKIHGVRAERNRRLTVCDWTQLADAPVDGAAWATYRQALREVPDQAGFPWTIDWPEAP